MRVRANEVVGLAGLLGSGTDRVLKRIFGVGGTAIRCGATVRRDGSPTRPRRSAPASAWCRASGGSAWCINLSVRDNILLPSLDVLRRCGRIDRAAGDRLVAELMELLDIRPRQPHLRASALSGLRTGVGAPI